MVLALSASACDCSAPVIDGPVIDGPDSGARDAGSDGGAGGGTCRIADCPARSFACPFTAPDAGGPTPSCIADACVAECGGGRTCDVTDAGRCLACGGLTRCAEASCTPGPRCSFAVEGSGCTGLLEDGARVTVQRGADCVSTMSTDAGVIGTWVDLDVGEALLNLPRLGGACTGKDLFTGVPRTQVFCPFCSFVAEGCE